jgi:uncharacterized protein (TIGR02246 family)
MDEQAIRAVLAAYQEAWNRHDMAAWGRLFTDDVDYVNRAGGHWEDNAANVAAHTAIHEALARQSQKMTWSATVQKIRFLAEGVALVHATWNWPGVISAEGQGAKDLSGIMSLVLVKQDGRWLIRSLHNTVADDSPLPGRREE